MRACVIIILKVHEHDILQTASGHFKFTTSVQLGTKMNCLDFDIKRPSVKAMTRPNVVENHLFKNEPFLANWRNN